MTAIGRPGRAWGGVAACALACALAWPGAADGRLRTLATADASRGWEAVGRLDLGSDGFCTAALIAAEIVLTAAHCLFDSDTGEALPIGILRFRPGLRHGRAEAHRGIRRVVVHPDFARDADGQLDRVGADLALLELDRPVRLGHVRPFRTRLGIGAGERVEVVSYAKGREDAPSLQSSCAVIDRDADVLILDCEVDFGASGAPVFTLVGGEMRIVSVISAKGDLRDRPVALAASIEGEIEPLLAAIAATPAVGPVRRRPSAEPLRPRIEVVPLPRPDAVRLPRGFATGPRPKIVRPPPRPED